MKNMEVENLVGLSLWVKAHSVSHISYKYNIYSIYYLGTQINKVSKGFFGLHVSVSYCIANNSETFFAMPPMVPLSENKPLNILMLHCILFCILPLFTDILC